MPIEPLKFKTIYRGGQQELQDKVEELTSFINEVLIPAINSQEDELDEVKHIVMEEVEID